MGVVRRGFKLGALAVAALALALFFISACGPVQTQSDKNAGSRSAQTEDSSASVGNAGQRKDTSSEASPAPDYCAVLHEDGSLVFQAQPSDEEGAVNYCGSCAAYPSGMVPWLENAELIESVRFDESFASTRPEALDFWFAGCKNLKTVDLENLDASASTSMRSMFAECSSLETIEHLTSLDTSSSTYFGSMFRNCSSLTSLDVSHFDATHVEVLCFMFAGCTNLETLNMAGEGWRTSSLYLMVRVWEGCSSLKSLDLSFLDTSGVRSMARDFNGCSALEDLDLSGFDTSQVGALNDMFNGCNMLKTVKLGSGFTFCGKADEPQCSLPKGAWESAATGDVFPNADVPNNRADTYKRISGIGEGAGNTTGSPGPTGYEPGEYALPDLKSSLGMFNHFVEGTQKLTVSDDKVTLAFTTDGSIKFISKVSKVAIGPSSKLVNAADMKDGETKYANSLLDDPAVFEGTLVSAEGEPGRYAYQLEFGKAEFERMIAEDGGIYLTLFYGEKDAWHKGENDLLLTLGNSDAPAGDDYALADANDELDADPSDEMLSALDGFLADGEYELKLAVLPSMVKLSGHRGLASEPRLVVSGDDAWVITSYRSTLGSSWRYGQMAWGTYEEVAAADANGACGAPTFKEGASAADSLSDDTLDAMTFALPISKADFIDWAASGEAREFTMRYVKNYSAEHDGDWWMANTQPTMALVNLKAADEPVAVPADYAAVFSALTEVPEDLSVYTEQSVKRLNESLASVAGPPKPASQQADVDAMAAAILNAVDALERNDG